MSSTTQQEDDYSTVKGVLAATLTSEIMVAVVITLFLIFLVLFFSYIYAKHYRRANLAAYRSSRVPIQFILAPEYGATPTPPRRGLDPAIIRSLPVNIIKGGSDNIECAVCICELSEGEEARVLPGCSHGFHLECIDMWFHSNNTCPLCRAPVVRCDKSVESEDEHVVDVIQQVRVEEESSSSASKRREGMLVIEIPRLAEHYGMPSTPLPLSRHAVEGAGAGSPMSSRLRSLRRILSGRGSMTSSSPRGGDHIA